MSREQENKVFLYIHIGILGVTVFSIVSLMGMLMYHFMPGSVLHIICVVWLVGGALSCIVLEIRRECLTTPRVY